MTRKPVCFTPLVAAARRRRTIVLSAILLLFAVGAHGQDADSLVRELVRKHIRINAGKMTMPGYRVQIYYGVQRARAAELKGEFMRDYPGIPSYLLYQQPNFKVRAGDYKTRLEALRLLDELQDDFPAAFVVPDEVQLPDLHGMNKE